VPDKNNKTDDDTTALNPRTQAVSGDNLSENNTYPNNKKNETEVQQPIADSGDDKRSQPTDSVHMPDKNSKTDDNTTALNPRTQAVPGDNLSENNTYPNNKKNDTEVQQPIADSGDDKRSQPTDPVHMPDKNSKTDDNTTALNPRTQAVPGDNVSENITSSVNKKDGAEV